MSITPIFNPSFAFARPQASAAVASWSMSLCSGHSYAKQVDTANLGDIANPVVTTGTTESKRLAPGSHLGVLT